MRAGATLKVPMSLLLTDELGAPSKLLWLVLDLDSRLEERVRLSPTRLAKRAGLAHSTVGLALSELRARKWYPRRAANDLGKLSGGDAHVPVALLTDTRLSAQARIAGALLRTLSRRGAQRPALAYAELAAEWRIEVRRLRRALRQLEQHGWLATERRSPRAPVWFRLLNPEIARLENERLMIEKRLKSAPYKGEALMREFLSIIVSSKAYVDDARPSYLLNYFTGEAMQFDRLYTLACGLLVAFEFNGDQHYFPSERFDAQMVAKQRCRDFMKREIAAAEGVTLVVIRPEDLTLTGMQAKAGNLLPLRDLEGYEQIMATLELRSAAYREKAGKETVDR